MFGGKNSTDNVTKNVTKNNKHLNVATFVHAPKCT